MRIEDVAAYLSEARIIDLSKKVTPGKAEGPLDTGKRKYEIKPFAFPPGEIMHNIEMESHISTHVEAPSHFVPALYGRNAEDVSEIALARFFGMAVLVDCKGLAPKTAIEGETLEKFQIKEKDIVLIGKCSYQGQDRCYFTHDLMLSNEIPIIEGLANLGELKTQRFLFFGFPAKMGGLESFPIRAVAIEA
jgi:kynurenine formamidase